MKYILYTDFQFKVCTYVYMHIPEFTQNYEKDVITFCILEMALWQCSYLTYIQCVYYVFVCDMTFALNPIFYWLWLYIASSYFYLLCSLVILHVFLKNIATGNKNHGIHYSIIIHQYNPRSI